MKVEPERLLSELSREVVEAAQGELAGGGASDVVAVRSRDLTLALDDAAESAMEHGLRERGLCGRVVSEERGDRVIGDGEPGFTLVFDPVDGSANAVRGLDLWVTAIAYSPTTADVRYADFTHSAVRVATGGLYHARRGGGAFFEGERIRAAGEKFPGKPMFSVYLSGSDELPPGLGDLLKKVKVRALGSVALDTCYVARGYFDGVADVRSLISAWDVMAAALVLEEAGGVLTGGDGEPVTWKAGEQGISFIAARTAELHSMLHLTL